QLRALAAGDDADAGVAAHADVPDPRAVVTQTLARQPQFVDRWASLLMDFLRVPRIEDQSADSCYGFPLRSVDDGALARHVRDNASSSSGDGNGQFSMLDLLRSALVLDDVSPVYRAHLYA